MWKNKANNLKKTTITKKIIVKKFKSPGTRDIYSNYNDDLNLARATNSRSERDSVHSGKAKSIITKTITVYSQDDDQCLEEEEEEDDDEDDRVDAKRINNKKMIVSDINSDVDGRNLQ